MLVRNRIRVTYRTDEGRSVESVRPVLARQGVRAYTVNMVPLDLTARIWAEDGVYVAECVELGVTSQGSTEADAFANLKEATELLCETADSREIISRLNGQAAPGQQIRHFAVACG